jgi:hypothetical protein
MLGEAPVDNQDHKITAMIKILLSLKQKRARTDEHTAGTDRVTVPLFTLV